MNILRVKKIGNVDCNVECSSQNRNWFEFQFQLNCDEYLLAFVVIIELTECKEACPEVYIAPDVFRAPPSPISSIITKKKNNTSNKKKEGGGEEEEEEAEYLQGDSCNPRHVWEQHVELPKWARNAEEFTEMHRMAFESEMVE